MTNATYHGVDGLRRWMAEIDDLTFAGERLIELKTIPDHADALEAVGLSE